ncbi:hypothetical protein GW17_00026900 [Ensete ventricosum]|nr:hypothetical protein GW17_00026900 [Ensete ventricosum]
MRSIAEKRLWSTCLRRWTAGPTRIWASIGRLAQFGAVKRTAGMPSRPPVGRRGWGPDRGGGSAPGACAGRFHVTAHVYVDMMLHVPPCGSPSPCPPVRICSCLRFILYIWSSPLLLLVVRMVTRFFSPSSMLLGLETTRHSSGRNVQSIEAIEIVITVGGRRYDPYPQSRFRVVEPQLLNDHSSWRTRTFGERKREAFNCSYGVKICDGRSVE